MGISDWDHDSGVIKEKLAKAYGRRPVEHDTAEATETISTKSSGFVLNIGADRKAELQAQLDQAIELQLHQTEADLSDSD
jgi:hypothetical protein